MTGSCNSNVFRIDLKKVNIEIYLIKKSNQTRKQMKCPFDYNLNFINEKKNVFVFVCLFITLGRS